jgi:hypothetical protein
MKMTPGSWKIYKVECQNRAGGLRFAYVVADMLEFGCEWPLVIHDNKTGAKFSFITNEVMEDWMTGNYSGHAKYLEFPESTTQSAGSGK